MPDRIALLEARLRLLEDRDSIRTTMARYAHTLDYGPAEDWVDCFTPDGVFDIRTTKGLPGFTERPVLTRGSAALLKFAKDHPCAPDEYRKHNVLVHDFLEIEGDHARVRSYFLIVHEMTGTGKIAYTGRYLDEMIKGEDGKWRIKERVAEITGTKT